MRLLFRGDTPPGRTLEGPWGLIGVLWCPRVPPDPKNISQKAPQAITNAPKLNNGISKSRLIPGSKTPGLGLWITWFLGVFVVFLSCRRDGFAGLTHCKATTWQRLRRHKKLCSSWQGSETSAHMHPRRFKPFLWAAG